jgi:pimeloyl-ACP methyl ester carboxylesterase
MTFGGCADTFLLHPQQGAIDAGPGVRRDFSLDGRNVQVWTARSPALEVAEEPLGYVLEFTGNGTRAEQIAQFVADRWKKHPIEAWVMNYPGYGGSAGGARLALIPPTSLATYDQLAKIAHGRPIFLEANSLGTTAALFVAAHRPAAGLVLQNPPPLQNLLLDHYGWWNLWLVAGPVALQVPSDLNSLRNAPLVTAPAIFLTADNDEIVPPAYHKKVIDAYAGEKRVIDMGAVGHNDSVTGDSETKLLEDIDWLWQNARK